MKLDDPHTLTRRDHGDTSHEAAQLVLIKTGTKRRAVLEELASWPCTDDELANLTAMPANTARPRRVELVRLGYVEDSGKRRLSSWGTRAIVWAITDKGREALRA